MASMNAATIASQLTQLENQVQVDTEGLKLDGPWDRFFELYELIYNLHLQKGGDVGAAVATVTRAFPGSQVDVPDAPAMGGGIYTNPQDSGPGSVILPDTFKKHAGKSIAQVYDIDPTYIRNFIAEKARDWELRSAAQAFLAQVDAA